MSFFLTHRGGQKLRYFTAAAISILIFLLLAALAWYVLIYSRREISYVEITFTEHSIPLSAGLSEQIEQLRGMTLKEASSAHIAEQLSGYNEISAAVVNTNHQGEATVRLTARKPSALLQLEEEDFYRIEESEGDSRLVTDMALLENGEMIPSYAELTTYLLNSVPVVRVFSLQRAVSGENRVDGQLRAFIHMLSELRQQEAGTYDRLSQVSYDRYEERGIECMLSDQDDESSAMRCTVPRPMSGETFASVIQAVSQAVRSRGESRKLTAALLSDHTVLLEQERTAK
ncbi:MAG: hypothetical protein ACQEQU_04560 [Spirochaetota bacterium]